jgi:hypothetical protein
LSLQRWAVERHSSRGKIHRVCRVIRRVGIYLPTGEELDAVRILVLDRDCIGHWEDDEDNAFGLLELDFLEFDGLECFADLLSGLFAHVGYKELGMTFWERLWRVRLIHCSLDWFAIVEGRMDPRHHRSIHANARTGSLKGSGMVTGSGHGARRRRPRRAGRSQ